MSVERLTVVTEDMWAIKGKIDEAVFRLAAIEDILGDNYNLDRLKVIVNQRMTMREEVAERFRITKDVPVERLKELVEADRDGRCVVLPIGGYEDKDGENALKSVMHTCYFFNTPETRYIADAVAEKLTREAAEATLEEQKQKEINNGRF